MRNAILAAVAVVILGGSIYALTRTDESEAGEAIESSARGEGERRGNREARGEDGPRRAGPSEDVSMEERVAKLERDVALLRRQVALGGGRRTSGGDADALAEQLDDPRLDSTVRDIVANERDRERAERWQRRSERALERIAETVSLTDDQQTAIAALWETEREQITPLFLEARSGERDFDEVIEEVEAMREATDTEVGKLVSADQLEAYMENRPRGPGGRGRGGDRGRGRGGQGSPPTPK